MSIDRPTSSRIPSAALIFLSITVPLHAADPALEESLAEIRHSLVDEMHHRWYPAAIDAERGGFHQTFGHDWQRKPDTNTQLVAQSRHAWTCAAYALFSPEHRERFSNEALDGLRFIERTFSDPQHGGLYWAIGADGTASDSVGRGKHVYGLAFAIYAACEVYHATGDADALTFAQSTFDWIEEHAHDAEHGGYHEALQRDGTPLPRSRPRDPNYPQHDQIGTLVGFKSMNTHIHLLEALTELSKYDTRPLVATRLKEVFEIVRDKIAVEPGCLCLFFTPDWRATAAHDSFGHDIETTYLLLEAAAVLDLENDPHTTDVARQLTDHALQWGWDAEYGGFYDKGDAFGASAYDTDKIWWVQAEGLNALAVLHVRHAEETPKYRDAFLKQWQFIRDHMIDSDHGGWHAETDRAGTPVKADKANQWKTNYHTARALMHVLKTLDAAK